MIGEARANAQFFNITGAMLSIPLALFGLRLSRASTTSCSVKLIDLWKIVEFCQVDGSHLR